jgi:hypothetical protein
MSTQRVSLKISSMVVSTETQESGAMVSLLSKSETVLSLKLPIENGLFSMDQSMQFGSRT